MVAFYNQGDQDIYNQGVKFRPQQKYLLDDYTAPTAPTAQIKPVPGGITNTNAFNYGGGGNDFSVYNPDPNSIVNKNYKRDPSSIAPEDRKWLDKDLIEPVKIEYPEVILGSEPTTKPTIDIDPRPIDQIVRDLADQRLVREQKDWDQRWGRDGIASLKRPD
jgi:hypothetical protein